MKIKISIILMCSLYVISCKSSTAAASLEQIQILDQLVAERSFTIESDWALPQINRSMSALQNSGVISPGSNPNRFSLSGISNNLTLKGEHVSSILPYFGEVQMPSGYNGSDNNSITFNGNVEDYKVVKNEDDSYKISFDAKSNNEPYTVTIVVYPSLESEMILRGSKRFPIRYTGHVKPISE